MNLLPEDNQSIDPNRLSVSKVAYKTVLSGIKQLYPPQDLSERNAISRTDGYWAFIKNGEEIPQGLTYGEVSLSSFSYYNILYGSSYPCVRFSYSMNSAF